MSTTIEKILSVLGIVVGAISIVVTTLQATGVWASGPPHWLAIAGVATSTATLIIARLIAYFAPAVVAK